MPLSKLTIAREFCLGVGMTLFLCLAPQSSPFWTGALFVGMFTIYETFPDFHWVPAWTVYKIVAKEEDTVQGAVRLVAQFGSAFIAALVGYQLLDSGVAAYPKLGFTEWWRSLIWLAFVWAGWLALTNHDNGKKFDGFRRNFALTATFCSANYLLQGVGTDFILNAAVNFGRLFGAKIYYNGKDGAPDVNFDDLWLILAAPAVGALLAVISLRVDAAFAAWDAPASGDEKTTAVYGSTGDNAAAGADDKVAVVTA